MSLILPEEEEEERREEIGGFELFGELYDSLVVAGITAGSSLSMPLQKKVCYKKNAITYLISKITFRKVNSILYDYRSYKSYLNSNLNVIF